MKIIKVMNKKIKKILRDIVYCKMYNWFSKNEVDLDSYMKSIDESLWEETKAYEAQATVRGVEELSKQSITVGLPNQGVGGGAEWAFLYFMVRFHKPKTMIETGVAMGWSTRAILDAMEINGFGHLFSTDLPYKHRPGREDVDVGASDVGCLVPEGMRDNWTLYLGSDREYLPVILSEIESIDLMHYDSDKSYEGRRWAMDKIKEKMSPNSAILMDDIKDNGYYMDFVKSTTKPWRILRQKNNQRWVGMIDV